MRHVHVRSLSPAAVSGKLTEISTNALRLLLENGRGRDGWMGKYVP